MKCICICKYSEQKYLKEILQDWWPIWNNDIMHKQDRHFAGHFVFLFQSPKRCPLFKHKWAVKFSIALFGLYLLFWNSILNLFKIILKILRERNTLYLYHLTFRVKNFSDFHTKKKNITASNENEQLRGKLLSLSQTFWYKECE